MELNLIALFFYAKPMKVSRNDLKQSRSTI